MYLLRSIQIKTYVLTIILMVIMIKLIVFETNDNKQFVKLKVIVNSLYAFKFCLPLFFFQNSLTYKAEHIFSLTV